MMNALNDPPASLVFIYCIIVWKCMLKCVPRVRIKIYIYNKSILRSPVCRVTCVPWCLYTYVMSLDSEEADSSRTLRTP